MHWLEVRLVVICQMVAQPHAVVDSNVRLSPLVCRTDRITEPAAHASHSLTGIAVYATR